MEVHVRPGGSYPRRMDFLPDGQLHGKGENQERQNITKCLQGVRSLIPEIPQDTSLASDHCFWHR